MVNGHLLLPSERYQEMAHPVAVQHNKVLRQTWRYSTTLTMPWCHCLTNHLGYLVLAKHNDISIQVLERIEQIEQVGGQAKQLQDKQCE
jgi:hypothetical protein